MQNKSGGILALLLVVPLNFGGGYYTNLCGSGTAATAYTCNSGCNPSTGSCTTTGDGGVKYVCRGNWHQCLENEAGWSNGVSVGEPGCDNTVQLSIYDHSCRRDDGSWDSSCQLLGYMVWYSGTCLPTVAGYATGIPIVPTVTKIPAPTLKLKTTPTSIVVAPTSIVVATSSAMTTPETGMPIWLWSLGILGLGYMGLKVVHIGKVLWS